ncbi:MAG: hypothetical protein GYB31_07480 [Bacteroidetes bacterium]|nr:hypothetical protein [Bacteroidota bacterium]
MQFPIKGLFLFFFCLFMVSCEDSTELNVDFQPTDEETVSMVTQSATTTRDVCTSCGCKADLINCSCATQKKLKCVLDNSLTAVKDIKQEAPESGPATSSD